MTPIIGTDLVYIQYMFLHFHIRKVGGVIGTRIADFRGMADDFLLGSGGVSDSW